VPKVLTPRKQARMHEFSDEWNGEWSDADMAAAINAEFGTTVTPTVAAVSLARALAM